ncbi:hypothetical protein AURDEDRAFT_169487 [Auricularia subglabra TFB-10046 SS5]|uniref:F-box domain-containing protein n=1 Tax=Auricularia subglabra (strain TFB-10046 / SS5) TaxID=717982 RepID=J0D2P0_AURST|nr:hypothetical protein AURDEDRAFT_169487 [Auricularia subglabra TFB-10046 SS5]
MSSNAAPSNLELAFTRASDDLVALLTRRSGHAVSSSDIFACRQRLDQAIADLSMGHNAAYGPKLPNELWCMIWKDLPLADRLRVTHTCRDWRALCLNTPHVWQYLDFWFYRHPETCTCIGCAFQHGHSRPVRNNSVLVSLALPRSRQLDLFLSIGDRGSDCGLTCSEPAEYLSSLLRPHRRRLRSIDAHLYNAFTLTYFLDEMKSFPALTSLSATSANDRSFGVPLAKERLNMPSLEQLSLVHGWAIWDCKQSFPAVKRLTAPYGWCNSLRNLVESCPNIASLDVSMASFALVNHDNGCEELAERISSIPFVRISNITHAVRWFITFIGPHPPPHVEYAYSDDPRSGVMTVLDDDAECFSCMCDGAVVRMRAEGPTARTTLTFPYHAKVSRHRVWETFYRGKLRHISADWPVWHLIADGMATAGLEGVESLTLYFPTGCDLYDPPPLCDEDEDDYTPPFPGLDVVTVRGGPREVWIPRSWWKRFLGTLRLRSSVRFKFVGVAIYVQEDEEDFEKTEDEEDEDEGDVEDDGCDEDEGDDEDDEHIRGEKDTDEEDDND